jgi:hypothetical protein
MPSPPLQAVSVRAVLIGAAIIPSNIIWCVLMERVDGRAFSTTASIFFTAVFSLLILVVLNAWIRRVAPSRALSQGELLVIFSMLSVATAMAGIDWGMPLLTLMGHGFWFATPSNGWEETFHAFLPRWLTVSDRTALAGYYLGASSLYRWENLRAWLVPIGWWTAFIMALLWVMACLNTLVRARWTERERLTYPMIHLPVAMTAPGGALYRSRLFWIGFALAGGLNLINGLHNLYPAVPAMTFNGFDAGQWFTARPWNAIGWTPLAVFPFIVGLGYLLPVDLLFSCWFFFIFWRMEKVASSAMGYMAEQPKFPYVDEQMFGAYMAVFAVAIYAARNDLRAILIRAFRRSAQGSDSEEAMGFRTAILGALAGVAFLTVFSYYAGMPIWLGALFFVVYFAIAVAITRMRAELGPPTHDLHFIGPDQSLTTMFGTRGMSGTTLGAMSLYYWFNRAYRCHPMPHQLEGLKMAQLTRTSPRGLLVAMGIAAFIGVIATFWVTLHVSYKLGAAARITGWGSLGYGPEAYNRLASWIQSPLKPNIAGIWAMVVGFAFSGVLMVIRMHVYGWPFHALGFAISGGWSMMWAWLSLFVAWVLKSVVLRYGGLRGYRNGLPFFFGIILGDFVIGGLWTILGLLMDIPIHSLWSG